MHHGAFAWIAKTQLVLNATLKERAVYWDRYEYKIDKDSWSLNVREIEITHDDKDKLFYHGFYLASMMMCFVNSQFQLHSPLFGSPETYV